MDGSVIIAGGGCAGLSLALRMRALDPGAHLIIIDPDFEGHPSKLWSFWAEDPQSHLPLFVPRTTWSKMRSAGPGWSRIANLGPLRYCTIRSEDFESAALAQLRDDPRVELRTGRVSGVHSNHAYAEVTVDGRSLRAPHAFQSCLPPQGPPPRYPLWQHFGGVVVRSSRPRFDPETFTLMDFDLPQWDGPTFLYELPFTAHEALIEHTVFSAQPRPPAAHREVVLEQLHARGFDAGDIVREEWGAIPMFERRSGQRRGPRAFNLGVVGGMAKPTTGYAFLRIQQQCGHLARSWAAGEPRPLPDPAWRLRAYDTALLDLIQRDPQTARRAFERLLRGVDAAAVLRFLDERPTVADELQIIFGALPWGPFLRSVPGALKHTPLRVGARRDAETLPAARPALPGSVA